jgi:hypothetical protein
MLLNTCKDDDPINNIPFTINYTAAESTFNLVFINASSGDPIGSLDNKKVTVTISGDFATAVTEISGQSASSYQSDKGFMTLALKKNVIPTNSSPVRFNISAEASGYLPYYLTIELFKDSHLSYKINMVETSNPPSGVANAVNTSGNANNGNVTAAINLQTNTVGTSSTKAALNIPQNVILKDAAGNTLNGALNVSLTYFNSAESTASNYFPGGGLMCNLEKNGTTTPSMLYSAGFVNINITDASGRRAAKVENGNVGATVEIPQGTYNPLTNTTVVAGDSIPLLSYNDITGKWVFERNEAVVLQNGKLVINSAIKHFSYYNWDWDVQTCSVALTSKILFKSTSFTNGYPLTFYLTAKRQTDGFELGNSFKHYGNYWFTNTYNGSNFVSLYMLCPTPVAVAAINPANNEVLGGLLINNPCQTGMNYDLFLSSGSQLPTDSVVINIRAYCASNPNVFISPSLAYWYKDISTTTTTSWIPGWMVNGRTVLRLINGHLYKFKTTFNSIASDITFTMGDPNYTNYTYTLQLPASYCQ